MPITYDSTLLISPVGIAPDRRGTAAGRGQRLGLAHSLPLLAGLRGDQRRCGEKERENAAAVHSAGEYYRHAGGARGAAAAARGGGRPGRQPRRRPG
jgi:hypothetical protein